MAGERFLVGNVRGLQGIPGTLIFMLTSNLSIPETEMRINDKIINTGTGSIIVGNRLMGVGDVAKITSLDPFNLSPSGNIGGIQGNNTIPITTNMVNPSNKMRVDDLVWNIGSNIINVGNISMGLGDVAVITSLNPFQLAPAGNVGGNVASNMSLADMDDQAGRNLLDVLNVATIPEAMQALVARCNGSGKPNFDRLQIGDYIDGLDLSGITGITDGYSPQAWNNTYKNNRFEIAGFNTYKDIGSTQNIKNHILMTFRDCIASSKLNSSNTNTGGFAATELLAWLEGNFLTALEQRLGITLGTLNLARSTKGGFSWRSYKIWLPSELEFFGFQTYGDELNQYNTNCQLPIYQKSYHRRIKRWNGSRQYCWTSTPHKDSTTSFVSVYNTGGVNSAGAGGSCGVSPVFCIAGV
jgi:hypothetical protein